MTSDHGFFILFSILLLLSPAGAQSETPPPPYSFSAFSPSVATVLVVIIAAMFFIGFFSVYLRLCSDDTTGRSLNPLAAAAASIRRRSVGLDASVIDSFPILLYSEVKEHKIGKGVLECAVCLNEFEEEETLRLIPKCDHVFHPECIDAWLASHVTCPVCRADLTPKSGDAIHAPELEIAGAAETQNRANNDFSDRIVVDQEPEIDQGGSLNRRPRIFGKFPRSHSTGHSLFRPGINTERFTLRLPEHVRKEVMTRALHRTTTFSVTEESTRRGRTGSNRGARSYRRLDRTVKSDRWVFTVPFFSQAQSMKSPRVTADGEGSTGRGMRSAVKLPSFKCLEPGADEAALVSAGPARPPI